MNKARQLRSYSDSRIDYGIVLNVLILAIIGILSVYATTHLIEDKGIQSTIMHAVWYCIGAIVVIVVMQFNSEQYWRMAPYLYAVGLALLVLVLIFYDREMAAETGARSWFVIGNLSFQPSEVFKPAYIVVLARVATEHNSKYEDRTIKTDFILLLKTALVAIIPMALIMKQNDLGTTLVVLAITAGIIFMSGVSWKILVPIVAVVVIVGGGVIYLSQAYPEFLVNAGILQEYQLARLNTWLQPFADTQGDGFQLAQSIKAIASGQLLGKGFGVSEVSVPVRESDFIFTTIGENFGFIGSSIVLFVFFVLIYQMVQVCFKTKNEFYTYIAAGVISMVLFHVVENVGMCIGLLPITGVPLPFISQGGSALIGNMIGIGLILSMQYHHKDYMFADADEF